LDSEQIEQINNVLQTLTNSENINELGGVNNYTFIIIILSFIFILVAMILQQFWTIRKLTKSLDKIDESLFKMWNKINEQVSATIQAVTHINSAVLENTRYIEQNIQLLQEIEDDVTEVRKITSYCKVRQKNYNEFKNEES